MQDQKELFNDYDLAQPALRKALLQKNQRYTEAFIEQWMKLPIKEKEYR